MYLIYIKSPGLTVSSLSYQTLYQLSQTLIHKQHKLLNTCTQRFLMFWFGNQNFTASITLRRSQKELHHDIHNGSHLQGSFKKQKIRISMDWSKFSFFVMKMTFSFRMLSFLENKLNSNCAFQILFANQGLQYVIDPLIQHRSPAKCFDNWTDLFRPSLILTARTLN